MLKVVQATLAAEAVIKKSSQIIKVQAVEKAAARGGRAEGH